MTETRDRLKKHWRVFYGLDGMRPSGMVLFISITTFHSNKKISDGPLKNIRAGVNCSIIRGQVWKKNLEKKSLVLKKDRVSHRAFHVWVFGQGSMTYGATTYQKYSVLLGSGPIGAYGPMVQWYHHILQTLCSFSFPPRPSMQAWGPPSWPRGTPSWLWGPPSCFQDTSSLPRGLPFCLCGPFSMW